MSVTINDNFHKCDEENYRRTIYNSYTTYFSQ